MSEWWYSFGDAQLDSLINVALTNNRNLEIAYRRIIQSQLQLKQARAALAPSFGMDLSAGATQRSGGSVVQSYSIQPTINWELIFWETEV